MRPIRSRHAVDALTGAATGLVPGALVVGAPLLSGVVGMPGSAIRYVLLSAALLSGLTAAVAARRRRRAVSLSATAAARCAAAACLLTAAAGLWPSVAVFCTAVLAAAVIGAPALSRHRGTTPWYAGALAGLGAAGAVTGALPDRPGTALAVCGCAGAALLIPAAVGGDGRTAPEEGVVLVTGAAPGTRGLSASVGAGTTAAFFAAQDLYVFRWELLGGSLATSTAVAAGAAVGLFTVGAAAASSSRAPSPARLPLLLLALGAAVTACAAAATAWQLTLALAGVLAVAAGCARLLCAGPVPGIPPEQHARWAVVGAVAGAGIWESAGRLVTAGDALVLAALWPVGAAVAWTVHAHRRARVTSSVPDGEAALAAADLTVRQGRRPGVKRLCLTLAPGEVVVLYDAGPGRRAGAVLRALAGIARPGGGRYTVHGHDIRRTGPAARWRLGLSAFLDPDDATTKGALPHVTSAESVGAALRAATAAYGDAGRAGEPTAAVAEAFPAPAVLTGAPLHALEPAERCVLGLAQTLIAGPRLLLLDLTAPAAAPLAHNPRIADVVRRVSAQGTAVLVAAPGPAPALPGRVVDLPGPARRVRHDRTALS
ncbi:hypothetical protein [Streptomyces gobiensis]|uniref:hypothetical protein n=1 Tax=Streptomyces gobiensis TaxID=2875706 RepID=UPI001E4B2DBB|nr:hypothetical protein [Streptomyces gobiensis]UGY91923.1 hypothetical protein test1122_09455 [Streptomyces gobiensis]